MKINQEVLQKVVEAGEEVLLALPVYSKNEYGGIEVFEYSKAYDKFLSLIRTDFAFDFEWMAWADKANSYLNKPEKIKKASLNEIRKILTCHIKNEALEIGHLAYVFDSGQLAFVIERLKELSNK